MALDPELPDVELVALDAEFNPELLAALAAALVELLVLSAAQPDAAAAMVIIMTASAHVRSGRRFG